MTIIRSDDVKDKRIISPLCTVHCDFRGHDLVDFGSLECYVIVFEKVKDTNITAE